MKALVLHSNGESEKFTVNGSINKFLNMQFRDIRPVEIIFIKDKYGITTEVAHAYFSEPYRITLHYTWLTEKEQKQFIRFVADHLTTSIYGHAFNVEMVGR